MSIKNLFSFFKKDTANKVYIINETSKQKDYICKKYENYLYHFKDLQQSGDYAPIAAYEDKNKEIFATAFLIKDENVQITVDYVLDYWKNSFNKKILDIEIISYIILYHVCFHSKEKGFDIARDIDDANAIAVHFKDSKNNAEGTIIMPYTTY